MYDVFARAASEVVSWVSANALNLFSVAYCTGALVLALRYVVAPLRKQKNQAPICPTNKKKPTPKSSEHANP